MMASRTYRPDGRTWRRFGWLALACTLGGAFGTGTSATAAEGGGACRGLSFASATDCSDTDLLALFCTGTRVGEEGCGEQRP